MKGHASPIASLLLATIALYFAFSSAAIPLAEASRTIVSDQTWIGNFAIGTPEDVFVQGCTLTVVDGNVTVYGNLTLQNTNIEFKAGSPDGALGFIVLGRGSLTILNCSILGAPIGIFAQGSSSVKASGGISNKGLIGTAKASDGAEVEIEGFAVLLAESKDSSKIRIARSSLGQATVQDGSTMVLEEVSGIEGAGSVDLRGSRYSNCARMDIFRSSLDAARVWGDGCSELNVAHSAINNLQIQGNTTLTFDNMTVTGEWKHNGSAVYNRRPFDHIGSFGIGWGEAYVSCAVSPSSDDAQECALAKFIFEAGRIGEGANLPGAAPPNLLPTGNLANITFDRKWEGKEVKIQLCIHYTEGQIEKIDPSTLKIYSYSPVAGWVPLEETGVNETGRCVWGTLRPAQESFSACFAALGHPRGAEPPPTLAGEADWLPLFPYIAATVAAIAVLFSWIYTKRAKG